MIEQDNAILILYGHQGLAERAVCPRPCSLLLRVQGKGVDVMPAEALERGDQVGAHALRGEMGMQVGLRVQCPGTAITAHRHTGHGFDTADHHQVLETGAHFHRAEVHRLQARCAEPVDLHPGDADIPVRHQRRGLGDVSTLVAHRRDAAQHDVIDLAGVELCTLLQGPQQAGHQVHRFDTVQGAIRLATATGRAYCIENQSLGHDILVLPGR
ncbi:hypothetical protein D3C78_1161790 [compost metagenome]